MHAQTESGMEAYVVVKERAIDLDRELQGESCQNVRDMMQ